MAGGDVLAGAWAALGRALSGQGDAALVLATSALRDDLAFDVPTATFVASERDLVKQLRVDDRPTVVAVVAVTPTLLRGFREAPPAVVVVTGPLSLKDSTELQAIAGLQLLGPHARLRVGPGRAIVCADASGELEGLCRALGSVEIGLALCPTPPWLPELLRTEALADHTVAGYVHARALGPRWVQWIRAARPRHVVVPIGIDAPALDEARALELDAAVAAHALEALTGPVFPAPRVIALVLAGLLRRDGRADHVPIEQGAHERAIWAQARRALPTLGSVVGMEEPDPRIGLQAPTAAFLAQRALLRVQQSLALLRRTIEAPPEPDDEGVQRAHEVLRGAGEVLTDHESKVVLRGFGLEVTRQAVASSASGAAGFAERIGYPVVLKALSPDLRRRSDVGGIELALTTAAAVRRAYGTIVDNIERRAPTARLDGILVAEMMEDGIDLRCGGIRLQSGEVAIYGRIEGGPSPAEPALALLPLSEADALLLAHAVVTRAPVPALRRQNDPDIDGLAQLFLRLARLFEDTGERIESVDLGPVRLVGPPRGYVTLDARITQSPHLEGL